MIKKYTNEEINRIQKEIFEEITEPTLLSLGFKKSEHNFSQYDYVPGIGYIYELFKTTENNRLVRVCVKNITGERTVKITLNIFENNPNSIEFALHETSNREERIDIGFGRGIFALNSIFGFGAYNIPKYNFGMNNQIDKLKNRIKKDIENIDYYINKWQTLHK